MWIGLLPILRCDRCGLRGIPYYFSSCPRCRARSGWALIDRRRLAGLLAWMRVEHVLVRQRVARQVVESVEARMVQGPTAVQVSPMNQSLLDPPDAVRATLAAQAMLSRRHY